MESLAALGKSAYLLMLWDTHDVGKENMKKEKCHGRFYIKLKLPGGEINAELLEENLYAHCCDCGHEFKAAEDDLRKALFETPYGLRGAKYRCAECALEKIEQYNSNPVELSF